MDSNEPDPVSSPKSLAGRNSEQNIFTAERRRRNCTLIGEIEFWNRDLWFLKVQSKMIHFVLLISRQGKVRLTKWYSPYTQKERSKVIRELSGMILNRGPKLCNFVEWRGLKAVYKRYASLYFCMCIDQDDNELEVLECIHHFVEILDRYFGSVCELDLIFNFHKAYYILDELLIAGELQESSKKTVARLIAAQDSLVETAKEQASSISNIIAQATNITKIAGVLVISPAWFNVCWIVLLSITNTNVIAC
ncbi:AP-1 complex subunit sigma-2, partial [Cucurbita argyrosperma subsp. sororia]